MTPRGDRTGRAVRDTLHATIGRLLFVGIPEPTLDTATRDTLETLQPGGIILFKRNAGTPDAVAALTAALHALPSHPIVAIDHEGGRVMRLGEPFTRFPPAADIGRRHDPDLAYRVGRAMAAELAGVGIDLSFAPVLDVNSNPANPVIGDRAFGSDPALVADLGVAMMRGLRDGGVVPCGKHFPGHGDTATDSHVELPTVSRSRAELERLELIPFRAAIAAGIPMLMTAHVRYPALDPEYPATLSRKILNGLLRDDMGFTGVVASDDLDMRAISNHQTIGAAAIGTLHAGADVLLVCQDLGRAVQAAAALEAAAGDGTLHTDVITTAAARVDCLRALACRESMACDLPNPGHRALVESIRA